jgi:hypothetical protein
MGYMNFYKCAAAKNKLISKNLIIIIIEKSIKKSFDINLNLSDISVVLRRLVYIIERTALTGSFVKRQQKTRPKPRSGVPKKSLQTSSRFTRFAKIYDFRAAKCAKCKILTDFIRFDARVAKAGVKIKGFQPLDNPFGMVFRQSQNVAEAEI